MVGTAGFFRSHSEKERHKGHLWGVYVTPTMRGRGVAHALLHSVLDHASGAGGVEQIHLGVATTQTAAIRLYESLGFQRYGHERRALKIGDCYFDHHHVVLFLRE